MEPKEEIIKYAWKMYRQMDLSAVHYKKLVKLRHWLILICLILAAFLAVSSTLLIGNPQWILQLVGYASAFFFGLGTIISQASTFKEAEKIWTTLRTSAEYLKQQIYLYRCSVGEYSDDAHKNMANVLTQESEITKSIRLIKVDDLELLKNCPSGSIDIETYIKERVENQIDWFQKRLIKDDSRLVLLERVVFLFGVLGVILGLFEKHIWISAFSTAILAIQLFGQDNRYNFLAVTYQTTIYKLSNLLCQYRAEQITNSDLILGIEQVITYETVASMSEFMREGPKLSM